jgi:hypothetical protein
LVTAESAAKAMGVGKSGVIEAKRVPVKLATVA